MLTIKNIICFDKIKHVFYTGLNHILTQNFYQVKKKINFQNSIAIFVFNK